jgi:bacterioferritin
MKSNRSTVTTTQPSKLPADDRDSQQEFNMMPGQADPVAPRMKSGRNGEHASSSTERKTLIDGLNHDLAGELRAIVMYTCYSAMVTGPCRQNIRALFLSEIADEQKHAQFLADKIAALGGKPTTEALAVPQADKPRDMLKQALTAEMQAITGYTARLGQAERFGDFGLKVILENQIADETRHKEEIERILAGWKVRRPNRENQGSRWQDDGGANAPQ